MGRLVMYKGFGRAITCTATAMLALLPVAARAQQETPLSAEEVRADFVSSGYQVGPSYEWWTDGSTSFLVRPASGSAADMERLLLVIVYPAADTAEAARQQADSGLMPHPPASFWWENVALVESSQRDLSERCRAQALAGMLSGDQVETQAQPALDVDADFVSVLLHDLPTVNL